MAGQTIEINSNLDMEALIHSSSRETLTIEVVTSMEITNKMAEATITRLLVLTSPPLKKCK